MSDQTPDGHPRVVIIGGGFGGIEVAKRLRKAPVDVTLIDRNNYHLFQPLLYQVGTGGLSPANISTPLRAILGRIENCNFLLGNVTGIDRDKAIVQVGSESVPYDYLIVAAGSVHNYFGNDHWQHTATGLKSIDNALEMRRKIYSAYEAAERVKNPQLRQSLMTFVVVGGGPTGVELVGALAEIARHTLRYDFREIDPEESRIILVETGEALLSQYSSDLCERAKRDVEKLGVEVRLKTRVTNIAEDHVVLESEQGSERIETHTVLWAAGVQANPLGKMLAEQFGRETDAAGRLQVTETLNVPDTDNVFVIGDMAAVKDDDGDWLPGVAPVAIQEGKYVAKRIEQLSSGGAVTERFKYRDLGSMATIGRAKAVAEIGRLKFTGLTAWLLWLGVHVVQIMQFPNRVLILIQWAWNYLTFNRTARIITGSPNVPEAKTSASAIEQHEQEFGVKEKADVAKRA